MAMQTLRQLLPPQILADSPQAGYRLGDAGIEHQRRAGIRLARLAPRCGAAHVSRRLHQEVHRYDGFLQIQYLPLASHGGSGLAARNQEVSALTEVGAYRAQTQIPTDPKQWDGKPYGGFYTQDEAREIVAYAAEARHHRHAGDRTARAQPGRAHRLSRTRLRRKRLSGAHDLGH